MLLGQPVNFYCKQKIANKQQAFAPLQQSQSNLIQIKSALLQRSKCSTHIGRLLCGIWQMLNISAVPGPGPVTSGYRG